MFVSVLPLNGVNCPVKQHANLHVGEPMTLILESERDVLFMHF